MKQICYLIFLAIALSSCKNTPGNTTKYKPEATGNPYDVLIVAPENLRSGAAFDSLRNILQEDMAIIDPPEPIADIRATGPANLNGVLKKHRNIFMLSTDEKAEKSSIGVSYDLYATPQMVVYIDGRNADSLAAVIHRRRNEIQKLIDQTEQERFVARMKRFPEKKLNDTIDKMFDIRISIPSGYQLRNVIDSNFIWISYEMPNISQGIFIYSYPYDPTRKFSVNNLINTRNQFGMMVPGQREGSYMSTSEAVRPIAKTVRINGRPWIEMKGFWELANDFMGGVFTSYTTLDKQNGRVLCIDNYVYSPKPGKGYRNYLKQLEAIVRTVSFPKQTPENAAAVSTADTVLLDKDTAIAE